MATPTLNTTTLGGLSTYDPPDVSALNRFVCRSGASRWGTGVFVMLRSDYLTLATQATTTLVMKGDPGPGLTMTVVIGGAEPIITTTDPNPGNDLVKVTVYDIRAQNFGSVQKGYNVMVDGFPLDGSFNPVCYSTTLESGSTWPWKDLLTDSEIIAYTGDDDVFLQYLPGWTPFNIIWDNVPSARALDEIAAQLFLVVGFNPFDPTGPGASNYILVQPNGGFSSNKDLATQAENSGARLAGDTPGTNGGAQRNLYRLPKTFKVIFPGIGGKDPFDHRAYVSQQNSEINNATGAPGIVQMGMMPAIWNGSAWANQSTLDMVAMDMATRAGAFISQNFGQLEYAGIWPFQPDGVYRQVEWISYPKGHPQEGARTILKSDNAKDWLPTDQLNDPINLVSPQEIVGLGRSYGTIGAGGTKYVWRLGQAVGVAILANSSRPGEYQANIPLPTSCITSGSSSLAASDFGNFGSFNAYARNTREVGSASWALVSTSLPDIVPGIIIGVSQADGKPVVEISVCQ